MDFPLTVSSFAAGLLTFLAPCTLPLVPAYLGLLGGVDPRELQSPQDARRARRRIMASGIFFVLGFSVVFIALGALAGTAGSIVGEYRPWMERLSGMFIIVFGLMMLDVVHIPFFSREHRMNPSLFMTYGRKANAFMFGSVFALGWTPCIGPVLGTILLLASNTGTVMRGTMLLGVFSLGFAVPFLVIAFFIQSASPAIARMALVLRAISVVGGALLITLGVMLLSGTVGYFISTTFHLLRFIKYDTLLNYL